jgi:hypothetical protein
MSYERIALVLQALDKRTKAGEVPWNETETKGVFQTSFPSYSVRLFQASNPFEDASDFVLQIINESGDVVEETRDTDLTDYFEKPYIFMRDLYERARRRAMGVDDAIDEILRALQK